MTDAEEVLHQAWEPASQGERQVKHENLWCAHMSVDVAWLKRDHKDLT